MLHSEKEINQEVKRFGNLERMGSFTTCWALGIVFLTVGISARYFLAWIMKTDPNEPELASDICLYVFGGLGLILIFSAISIGQHIKKQGREYKKVWMHYLEASKTVKLPGEWALLSFIRPDREGTPIDPIPYGFMIAGGTLNFFPANPTPKTYLHYRYYQLVRIPPDGITHFYQTGEKYYENKISGGGSTGPNIGGAIIGNVIAGGVGAIIGGQSQTEAIQSELITHDERVVVISTLTKNGLAVRLTCSTEIYEPLNTWIPEKNKAILDVIQQKKIIEAAVPSNRPVTVETSEATVIEKIKKLQQLRDSGLIDDAEFQARKSKLLDTLM
jgi:hypothetical protein